MIFLSHYLTEFNINVKDAVLLFPRSIILEKKDLAELTSQINYSYFDQGDSGCERLHSYSSIKDELHGRYQNTDLPNISDNIVRALCYIFNKKRNRQDDFEKELCSYLYYWIGAKIYSKIKSKTLFSNIISMIYQELSTTDIHNTCNLLHKDIDEATFNTYKLLFDYSKDRANINLDTVYGNARCDEEYINFVQNYINNYMNVYSYCNENTGNKYNCGYFKELFQKYTHTDLNSFYCMQHNVQSPSTDEQGEVEPSRKSLSVTRSSRGTLASVIHPNPKGDDGQNWDHNLHEAHGLGGRPELGSDVSIPTDETAKSGSTKSIMGSVVPVLGVSSFSLLLYKVTENII
ncbi:hypothetical protein PVBG_05589 [Plasmodium vivax Brazil I]|uniref:Variable surface protein Vir7-like protein n=1 Tax=Plasmodium vivax (strain Brazil I) TaxID=1033975 RepID=A0A0J9SNA3_PLAV1|nr:hypothetical protein PVBG_05589 [Plasmodium vivax Brazil I]